ncbi:cytochrome c oxidase subunit 7A1, mitochondrial-like isoform X1 [Pyxicephalus adspersus]|uniref:cytochrome c oxidase subunit 7A1, mitochondrial-like isoform X1 n=1 Tax=Pyxicephalus adspersus TaxID=30357 RepID=UPI003B5B3DBC
MSTSLSDVIERTRGTETSSMRNFMVCKYLRPLPPARCVLGQRLCRSLSTSSRAQIQNRVLEKQKIFQADNDLPVHLKGGIKDVIYYRITMGITMAGTALSVYTIVHAAFAHK